MRLVLAVDDPPIWTLPVAEADRIRASLPDDAVIAVRGREERGRWFPEADVILTTWISTAEARRLERTRWIHSTAVGVGPVLKPGVLEREIVVTNSRGVQAEAIAEHAIALALALRRGLHVAHARQLSRTWAQEELFAHRTRPASSTCLLVVGLGEIGSRVAAMAHGLGMRVIGVRRRPELPAPTGVSRIVGHDRLRDALAEADVVVLAAPHTRETDAFFGVAELAAMRPSAVLVNVGRGALVDEAALVEALERGRIAAAGLDAFVEEPLGVGSPLWALPNALITPHSASFQDDYWGPAIDLFLDNMSRFRRGEPLLNVVDPARGY